ncbi:hypothetical protein BJ742DRAFT_825474 [Cladochytrium replicatum]|nr:hypothetical protein BJ742DRAFT_825474 [Cladochytrium replicatum]
MYKSMIGVLFILGSISSVLAACQQGEFPCGGGCMPLSAVCCDSKTHYCATRETCSTTNGTAVCVQGCLVGSAQGSQECGTGCIQNGNVCCGSSSTKFWACGAGGRCDTVNSACFAFGTNAQEPGREINTKIVTQANSVTNVQSPSTSAAGSSATSPAGGNAGNSNQTNNNKDDNSTIGIILIVVVAAVDSSLAGFMAFMCLGYKRRVARIEKVRPKPLMDRHTYTAKVPMYPPAAALNPSNRYIP